MAKDKAVRNARIFALVVVLLFTGAMFAAFMGRI